MLDRTTQLLPGDTLGLPVLTAWMATQDPAAAYDYTSPWKCPTARYLEAQGFRDVEVVPHRATFAGGKMTIPPEVDYVLSTLPYTYGAAVERARAL